EERARRVQQAARLLDLDEQLLNRKPKQLSGGQRQRVAMGRAIVREPKVFLMDEPLSNLDAKLRVQTRSQIAELQRRLGITTVYVTHDQVEAMTMGNRVAVLREGRLQQCATPRELYDNPVNQFVAGFIGSPAMNLRTVPLADGAARLANTLFPLPASRPPRGRAPALPARPQPLHARTLAYWAGRLPAPAYDRRIVTPGVIHFGVGGFHRAHQAMYHDRLMNQGTALDWGICGVGVLPQDRRMKQALQAQDGLYTLVLKHGDGRYEPRVIGSIVEYLFAPDDPEAVIEKMAAASTRIVSLTVTEGGYNVSDITGEFDAASPGVLRDLEPGAVPRTIFGLITEALRRRRQRGLVPFTVVSCDNLPGNGELSRRVFTAFARLRSPELAGWIEDAVRFPNSMVDRITPATTDADRAE